MALHYREYCNYETIFRTYVKLRVVGEKNEKNLCFLFVCFLFMNVDNVKLKELMWYASPILLIFIVNFKELPVCYIKILIR